VGHRTLDMNIRVGPRMIKWDAERLIVQPNICL